MTEREQWVSTLLELYRLESVRPVKSKYGGCRTPEQVIRFVVDWFVTTGRAEEMSGQEPNNRKDVPCPTDGLRSRGVSAS